MIGYAIIATICLYVCITFPEVYGLLPVTTRQTLCLCTCSSGSRYLRRHASSITDVHMIGCVTFGDDTSFFVLMHMFFWI